MVREIHLPASLSDHNATHLNPHQMALFNNKLQELLPLFPTADHKKLEEVYHKIPGTLLKFIDPIQITKTVECREQNLQVDSSMFVAEPHSPMTDSSSVPTYVDP